MHRLWVLLLLAGPVTAGSLRISMSYPEALEEAINLYNEVEEVKFLYRLLRAEPQPDWDPWAEGPQPLVFSVKETICPANQGFDFSTCDFKDDGIQPASTLELGMCSFKRNSSVVILPGT
ncbi:batroxicidin-like [Candoia aspera]|uniref:batroxicidin-like n=1 Tax=Candoia aspera TaxID=51853 RepID=UPI002FD7AB50